jgi:hypothetical protein
VASEIRRDERAVNARLQSLGANVLESATSQQAAEPPTLELGIDLCVDEDPPSARASILREADNPIAESCLVAARLGVVDDAELGLVLGRRRVLSSRSA